MEEVIAYIEGIEDEKQRDLMEQLHHFVCQQGNLQPKIRFKIPFYFGYSWICYLNPIKTAGVELAFVRGNELSNTQGILEFQNRKQVMGIQLFPGQDIPWEHIREIMQEALILDEVKPYRSK